MGGRPASGGLGWQAHHRIGRRDRRRASYLSLFYLRPALRHRGTAPVRQSKSAPPLRSMPGWRPIHGSQNRGPAGTPETCSGSSKQRCWITTAVAHPGRSGGFPHGFADPRGRSQHSRTRAHSQNPSNQRRKLVTDLQRSRHTQSRRRDRRCCYDRCIVGLNRLRPSADPWSFGTAA